MIVDTAISFDPFSSHGITIVIYTAEKRAIAIKNYLNREAESLNHYLK